MPAKTIGFAVAEEDGPMLDHLVSHFGHGNRSEFLRVAMKRLSRDLKAEKFQALQTKARADLGGRVVSREEVMALVRKR